MATLIKFFKMSFQDEEEISDNNLLQEELKLLSAIDIGIVGNSCKENDGKLPTKENLGTTNEEGKLAKDRKKLEIIAECDYLARLVVEQRLGSSRCKVDERHTEVWKYLMRGMELYINNGSNLLEGKARNLWITNKCEYSTFQEIASELVLRKISWIQICGLFALLDRLAAFCKMFGRSYVAKLAAGHLATFIVENSKIIDFLEENGGWVRIVSLYHS